MIGNSIRRQPRPSSPTIQALLRHLDAQGFDGAPKALGFDQQGREVLSYIPGSAEHYPWRAFVYSEDNLYRVARLLSDYHRATAGFMEARNAIWLSRIPGSAEVICHGDIGPYNTIYVGQKAVAFIDFETAAPGPRAWDVAFAVYRFTPLCELSNIVNVSEAHLKRVAQRIRRFCNYYGFERTKALLDILIRRLEYQIVWLHSPDNVGISQKAIAEEHIAFFQRDIAAIVRHASRLGRHL